MPTYDYLCERCGPFEAEQKVSDPPLTQCPRSMLESVRGGFERQPCDGAVRRLISGATSFVLKGRGWAKDGY